MAVNVAPTLLRDRQKPLPGVAFSPKLPGIDTMEGEAIFLAVVDKPDTQP
jgi:hypothetical protein